MSSAGQEARRGRSALRKPQRCNPQSRASVEDVARKSSKKRRVSCISESRYKEDMPLSEGNFSTVFAGYRIEDHLPTVCGETLDVPLEVLLLSLMGTAELLDWFDLDEEVIIVMERPVPCIDLMNFVENANGRLQEDMAKDIVKQLLDAAAETLSAGVFHQDIKLENILLHTHSDVP
ncbi:hypothetical protein LDENG_00168280 [Lucifuga dentata]|nr:hypothetical protein LDENG_00168280 [Lucifuga dentata]